MLKQFQPRKKIHWHWDKYKEWRETGDTTPVMFEFDPALACNQNCIWCSFGYVRDKFHNNAVMPRDVMMRAIKEMKELDVKAINWSVAGDEKILIEDCNGIISNIKISDFVDNFISLGGYQESNISEYNFNSYTLDKNFGLNKGKIEKVYRHPLSEKMYEIELETGRRIKVTKSHSLISNKNGVMVKVKPTELKIGDELICADISKIKKDFKINKEFCKILGYYISEGSQQKNVLNFVFGKHESDLINDLAKCLFKIYNKKIKIEERSSSMKITLCNKKAWLDILNHCTNATSNYKSIPDIIMNSNKNNKIEFLKSLYAGDGCYRSNKEKGKFSLEYKTSSKYLASDLILLLDSLGIKGCLQKGLNKRRKIEDRWLEPSIYYAISIYGRDQLKKIEKVINFMGGSLPFKQNNSFSRQC